MDCSQHGTRLVGSKLLVVIAIILGEDVLDVTQKRRIIQHFQRLPLRRFFSSYVTGWSQRLIEGARSFSPVLRRSHQEAGTTWGRATATASEGGRQGEAAILEKAKLIFRYRRDLAEHRRVGLRRSCCWSVARGKGHEPAC